MNVFINLVLLLAVVFIVCSVVAFFMRMAEKRKFSQVAASVKVFNEKQESVFLDYYERHGLIDSANVDFKLFPDENVNLSLVGLHRASHLPSKAYAVKIGRFAFVEDASFDVKKRKFIVWLVPEDNAISYWTVFAIKDDEVFLSHPIMGALSFPIASCMSLKEGERVKLRQMVSEKEDDYLLTYSFC